MTNIIKERNEIEDNYKWDLSTLFASDVDFEKALVEIDNDIQQIPSYEGTLKDEASILKCLKFINDVLRRIDNLFSYANLRYTEDTRETKAQSMYGRSYSKFVSVAASSAFVVPEILALSEEELLKLKDSDTLKDYKFYLENLLRLKEHTLTTREEQMLAKLSEGLSTSSRTSSSLMEADMQFEDAKDEKGESHQINNSNFVLLETSKDRTLRKNAFINYYAGYKNHINTFANLYEGTIKTNTAMANIKGFPSSREMSMAMSNIPVSVYDNLIDAVHKNMDKMHRYAALRKRILGVDELHYYDLYTPLSKEVTKKYTYEEAQELILEALSVMGDEYLNVVKGAFSSRWIDVYPNKGKRSGAFSAGTYDSNPYIMTNFTGTLDSVSTIAHEMGHSMHTYYTNANQPYHYANYTLFVAEVASTVNENLLIEHLLEKESDPELRLALLNQYLEGFKGTVYRQTMFAELEKEAHAMAERNDAINAEALNTLYERLVKEYFGEALTLDDEVKYEWARIPHFYRPFYVYVYATGYSSAVALSEKILEQKEVAVKQYLEFLSMGGSAYPLDELKHAGVDLSTPEPIEKALEKFSRVLDEAEKIADELGY